MSDSVAGAASDGVPGLAEALAEGPSTVSTWDNDDPVEAIRVSTVQAGWQFGHLAGVGLDTKHEVLAAIGRELSFEEYYGVNLDALDDCLDELLSREEPGGVLLVWDDWATLWTADRSTFDVLMEIFIEHSSVPGRPFVVFLRGGDPTLLGS